jgi:hypothetical protein
MKAIFTFSLLLFSLSMQSQTIMQLYTVPANPTTNDQVMVVAAMMFPSASCDEKFLAVTNMGGNRFDAGAMHCVGMLSVVCNDNDTFLLGQLTAGTYRFFLQEDMGMLPAPCSPGIVPGPVDSIDFTVTLATGLDEIGDNGINLFPNPVVSLVTVSDIVPERDLVLKLFSLKGQEVYSGDVRNGDVIDLTYLTEGIYITEVWSQSELIFRKKLMKVNE